MVLDRLRSLLHARRLEAQIADWLRHLHDTDALVRERAVRELGELRDARFLEPLLHACNDPNDQVRGWALCYLRDIAEDQLPLFLQAANDPSAFVREQACNALRYSSPEAIPVLLKTLGDEAAAVRREAIIGLGSLNAAEAIDAITALQQSDPDEDVREYAASTLDDFARRQNPPSYDWQPEPEPPADVPALLQALNSTDHHARVQACIALQRVNAPEAVDLLSACLQDADDELRAEAALALAASAAPPGYAPLLQRLKTEPAGYVRRRLVWALSFYPAEQCIPLLTQSLIDPHESVRHQAVLALQQLCERHELEMLLAHLPKQVPSDVADALADAIAEWDDDESLPAPSQRLIRLGTVFYE